MRAITILLCLLTVQPLVGAGRWRKVWKVSLMVLAASSAGDAASSWGGPEANPILANNRGRFAARGVVIKLGVLGAVILIQTHSAKRAPSIAPWLALGNAGTSALFTWATVHNMRVGQRASAPRNP